MIDTVQEIIKESPTSVFSEARGFSCERTDRRSGFFAHKDVSGQKINSCSQRNRDKKNRIKKMNLQMFDKDASDERTEGHAQIQADVVGAVGDSAFFGTCK